MGFIYFVRMYAHCRETKGISVCDDWLEQCVQHINSRGASCSGCPHCVIFLVADEFLASRYVVISVLLLVYLLYLYL